jgi:hypothetical protein
MRLIRFFPILGLFSALVFTPAPSFSKEQMSTMGFCGNVDFRSTPNEGLETILFNQDMSRQRPTVRTQCGLPGEKLNICSTCTNEFPEDSLRALRPMLGSKNHSDWHAKWHKVRTLQPDVEDSYFAKLQDAELVPKNISKEEFFKLYAQKGTLSGENFFFMHRMMIKMVQFELAMNGKPCVSPWENLPTTISDPVWPVPRKYKDLSEKAQDERMLQSLRASIAKIQSPEFLQKVTLAELGRIIEPGFHQTLHAFYRTSTGCTPEAKAQGFCDDLIPVETSPVNKHFWKLHGLIDQLLGHWLKANSYTEISTDCGGRGACYQWQGTWIGKYPKAN